MSVIFERDVKLLHNNVDLNEDKVSACDYLLLLFQVNSNYVVSWKMLEIIFSIIQGELQ